MDPWSAKCFWWSDEVRRCPRCDDFCDAKWSVLRCWWRPFVGQYCQCQMWFKRKEIKKLMSHSNRSWPPASLTKEKMGSVKLTFILTLDQRRLPFSLAQLEQVWVGGICLARSKKLVSAPGVILPLTETPFFHTLVFLSKVSKVSRCFRQGGWHGGYEHRGFDGRCSFVCSINYEVINWHGFKTQSVMQDRLFGL